MNENEKILWMKQALLLAKQAREINEVPVGAVLVREGQIIGQGFNRRILTGKTTAHAEIEALESYNLKSKEWRVFPGTSLFVTVEPCLMCTGALLWARVDCIYFGCADPKSAGIHQVKNLIDEGVFDHRFELIEGGVLEKECSDEIKDYFVELRKRKKAK